MTDFYNSLMTSVSTVLAPALPLPEHTCFAGCPVVSDSSVKERKLCDLPNCELPSKRLWFN